MDSIYGLLRHLLAISETVIDLLGRQVSALLFHPIACMQPAMARSFIGFF
jgi:hypothetical protein